MTAVTRTQLYTFYQSGDRPSQSNFQDLIDSALNIADVSGQFIQSDVSCGGTFEVSGALIAKTNANVIGDLTVSGNTIVAGGFTIAGSGNVATNGNLLIHGSAVFTNNLTVESSGSTVLTGNLNVTGLTTLATLASASTPQLSITTSGAPGSPAIILNGGGGLFSQDNGIVAIANASAEVLRVDNNGSLMVGTTNNAPFTSAGLAPGYIVVDLGVSAVNNGLEIISGTNGFIPAVLGFNNGITGTLMYFAASATNVGVISTDGTNTTYNTSSDLRKKELLSNYNPGELFDRLKVWSFNWKSNNKRDVGCVAQELYELVPNAVNKGDDLAKSADDNGFVDWHISYSTLVPYLIAEIKSLRKRVNALEKL